MGRERPRPAPAGELIGEGGMEDAFLRLYVKIQSLRICEEGQDLVEYALMMTLICLALISGIQGIAKAVNITFSNISNSLA